MPLTLAPVGRGPLPVELMNTIWADHAGVHDALTSVDELGGWLEAMSVKTDAPTPEQLARFRELRDALRVLAAEVTGDTRSVAGRTRTDVDRSISALNRASAFAVSWPELTWPSDGDLGVRTASTASAVDLGLAHIAGLATRLFGSEQRTKLGACYGPGCVLYFLREHPRRAWCSDVCGNRVRVARHYQRRKA